MKKVIAILVAAGACCALLAADFWQMKKFTEWDEKEVAKILKDSPWCHTFTVEVKRQGGGGGNSGGNIGGQQNPNANPNRGMGGGGGGGRGGRVGSGGGGNMGGGG